MTLRHHHSKDWNYSDLQTVKGVKGKRNTSPSLTYITLTASWIKISEWLEYWKCTETSSYRKVYLQQRKKEQIISRPWLNVTDLGSATGVHLNRSRWTGWNSLTELHWSTNYWHAIWKLWHKLHLILMAIKEIQRSTLSSMHVWQWQMWWNHGYQEEAFEMDISFDKDKSSSVWQTDVIVVNIMYPASTTATAASTSATATSPPTTGGTTTDTRQRSVSTQVEKAWNQWRRRGRRLWWAGGGQMCMPCIKKWEATEYTCHFHAPPVQEHQSLGNPVLQ